MRLEDKVAIVTGAAGGIGRSVSRPREPKWSPLTSTDRELRKRQDCYLRAHPGASTGVAWT